MHTQIRVCRPRSPHPTIRRVKNGRRELGSKYFGRAVKKWRLAAGLSQEELARRARVSATLVGTVERERGHISEEILCKLCLGLESGLGKPILGAVFYDGLEACWADLLAVEQRLRQEWGLEMAEYETLQVTEEALEQAVESAFTEVKKCWRAVCLGLSDRACAAGAAQA